MFIEAGMPYRTCRGIRVAEGNEGALVEPGTDRDVALAVVAVAVIGRRVTVHALSATLFPRPAIGVPIIAFGLAP